ncbi:MAG: N-formylglutamate amidohydrolase [Phycisphaerales bacterium JB039]
MAERGGGAQREGERAAQARGDSPGWRPTMLLLTCEHGGRRIPAAQRALFRGAGETLRSHRGWDPGALALAQRLAAALAAPLIFSTTSRLLVELNRSLGHPQLFSEFTRGLSAQERQTILEGHYFPYRSAVERAVRQAIGGGERVLHLSVHSFVERLGDAVRTVEVGLLFDPSRAAEAELCAWWLGRLRGRRSDARANEPYLGTDDGLTTALRSVFGAEVYAGVELEVRSDLLGSRSAPALGERLAQDLGDLVLAGSGGGRD